MRRISDRKEIDNEDDADDDPSSPASPYPSSVGAPSPPLPRAALPRRLPVYVMTSDVYERRRRDLSPLLPPSKRSLSCPGPLRCAPPPHQSSLRPQSEGKGRGSKTACGCRCARLVRSLRSYITIAFNWINK